MNHESVEKNIGLMGVLIALVISIGGLVQIVPLYFQGAGTRPAPGIAEQRESSATATA